MNEETKKIYQNKENKKTTKLFIQGNIENKVLLFAEAVENVFKEQTYATIFACVKTNQGEYDLAFTPGNVARNFEKVLKDTPLSEIEIEILGKNYRDITEKIMNTYKPNRKTGKLVLGKNGKSEIEEIDYNS